MTLETFPSQMGMASKQLLDRYAEYPSPAHDQPMYFPYEPSPTSQGHIPLSSKHHYGGGGHKNNAAMSALTLLAFLFFLHILQQCIKEHMTALNTPQVMIMTSGKEGEETIRHIANKKVDKTGMSETDAKRKNANNPGDATELPSNYDDEKLYTKITSSEYAPWKKFQKYPIKNDYNTDIPDFFKQIKIVCR